MEELFGEFTYTIPLDFEHHVTAIIAPNGTGKTLCLRMIAALFEQRWTVFSDNIFSRLEYQFNEGTIVEIQKVPISADAITEHDARSSISITVKDKTGKKLEEWTPRLLTDPRRASQIDRHLPYVHRITPSTWRDVRSGETYNLSELLEEFRDSLPDSVRAGFFGKNPEVLTSLTKQIDCHLIETQRLLILRDDAADSYSRPGRRPSTLAISRKAQELKEIISQQLNVYATLSQSLDRSFPRRVISHFTTLNPEDLRSRLQDLDVKRKELMEAGILATGADEPVALPEGPLEPAM